MKRNKIRPDIFHYTRACQKMREAGNWNGVSLKREYEDFLEYMKDLRNSGDTEQLQKAEAFLKEHYEPLLGPFPSTK